MKNKEMYDEVRYNFYSAMNKIVDFYKGYIETKKTKEAIIAEANELKPIFDVDLFVDSEEEMQIDADNLARDIRRLFDEPITTVGDLIYKGKEIMELKDRIELFEYWYC